MLKTLRQSHLLISVKKISSGVGPDDELPESCMPATISSNHSSVNALKTMNHATNYNGIKPRDRVNTLVGSNHSYWKRDD